MPTKKEKLVTPLNSVDSMPLNSQESLVTNDPKTTKPAPSKRKTSQTKPANEAKAISEAIETTASSDSIEIISKKQRKETHSKEKYYVRNDLLKKLKALTKSNGKSFKTSFINDAIEKSLNELEASNK